MGDKKNILCHKCNRKRVSSQFRKEQDNPDAPICTMCQGWQGVENFKGRRIEIKQRKCINCGMMFSSIDDMRYCPSCKRFWGPQKYRKKGT